MTIGEQPPSPPPPAPLLDALAEVTGLFGQPSTSVQSPLTQS